MKIFSSFIRTAFQSVSGLHITGTRVIINNCKISKNLLKSDEFLVCCSRTLGDVESHEQAAVLHHHNLGHLLLTCLHCCFFFVERLKLEKVIVVCLLGLEVVQETVGVYEGLFLYRIHRFCKYFRNPDRDIQDTLDGHGGV